MEIKQGERGCRYCGKALRGRSDKRFCNDQCRSQHNNPMRSEDTRLMRVINTAIRRNRAILRHCLKKAVTRTISREELSAAGFSFRYHTHTRKKGAATNLFCYEFGWRETGRDAYRIWKERKI